MGENSYSSTHCVKSVQIGRFFWSILYRTRAEYGDLLSTGKYDQKKLRIWTLFMQWHILRSDWFIWKLHECCNYVNILLFTPILLLISWNPLESIHDRVHFYCSYSIKLTFLDFVFNLILSNSVNCDAAMLQSYMIFLSQSKLNSLALAWKTTN